MAKNEELLILLSYCNRISYLSFPLSDYLNCLHNLHKPGIFNFYFILSQGLNAYHGLAALGEALGDDVLKATGQITLATETRSVREYFHVREHNR